MERGWAVDEQAAVETAVTNQVPVEAPSPLPPWLAEPEPAIPDLPGGVQDLGERLAEQNDGDDLAELRGALVPEPKKRRLFGRR